MKPIQSYSYVGPKEIEERVDEKYEGQKIIEIEDIQKWIASSNQNIVNENLIVTFVINEDKELVISDRHSEHIQCAGGRNVLAAGEITFSFEEATIYVVEISNQSTGYCPKPTSWKIVESVLTKIKIEHPDFFTRAFEFRYCENCKSQNLIKEEIFECAVCGANLDLEWNIYKMKKEEK